MSSKLAMFTFFQSCLLLFSGSLLGMQHMNRMLVIQRISHILLDLLEFFMRATIWRNVSWPEKHCPDEHHSSSPTRRVDLFVLIMKFISRPRRTNNSKRIYEYHSIEKDILYDV